LYRFLNTTTSSIPAGTFVALNPGESDWIEYNISVEANRTVVWESDGATVKKLVNNNVTLSDFFDDRTNTIAIYTDIDAPNNASGGQACGSAAYDWEKLGQSYYGEGPGPYHNGSDQRETDGNPTGTAEIYSDEYGDPQGSTYIKVAYTPRVSAGFNYIKMGQTFDFPGAPDNANCRVPLSGSMTQTNFTTPVFEPVEVQLFGSQFLGGCDNGFNQIWVDGTEVLDMDTPPGTSTYLPPKVFSTGSTVQINVSDKDNGRYTVCGDRSKIYYTYRIPSQVGFGETFDKCAGTDSQIFYYDNDHDGDEDGDVTPDIGPNPDGYDPCTDGVDDALWRLLDTLNFLGDNLDGGDACDDGAVLTNVTSDGNETNPIDLEIDPTDIQFSGTSLGSIPYMGGPLEIKLEVWA
jgi:hypothetical protein